MDQSPVNLSNHQVGIREVCLLLIAAGFALLMMDFGNLAVISGWCVVALWAYGMFRGPRPTWKLTLVYGAGLFVTTFWWPQQGLWLEAIALMWVGVAMMMLGAALGTLERRRSVS